jgi:hypothetical protein
MQGRAIIIPRPLKITTNKIGGRRRPNVRLLNLEIHSRNGNSKYLESVAEVRFAVEHRVTMMKYESASAAMIV